MYQTSCKINFLPKIMVNKIITYSCFSLLWQKTSGAQSGYRHGLCNFIFFYCKKIVVQVLYNQKQLCSIAPV